IVRQTISKLLDEAMGGTGASPRPSGPPPTALRLVSNEVCARARKPTPEAGVLPSPNSASSNPPVVPAPSHCASAMPPRLRLLLCAIRAFSSWHQIRLADGSLFVQTTSAFVQCAKSNDFPASTHTR